MTVTLPPELEALIQEQVSSGRYGDAADVVREALRLLAFRDQEERLRAEVGLGFAQLDRGEGELYTAALMDRLRREAAEDARHGRSLKDAVIPSATALPVSPG